MLLPQPEGPSSATNEPPSTRRSIGPKAWTAAAPSPKVLAGTHDIDGDGHARLSSAGGMNSLV